MLSWCSRFSIFCFLDNRQYNVQPQQYECLLAAGVSKSISSTDLNAVDQFLKNRNWVFGHLSYELKNSIHHITATKDDKIGFAPLFFFTPKYLLQLSKHQLKIEADDPELIYRQIINEEIKEHIAPPAIKIEQQLSKEAYQQKIKQLQQHIVRGDCYEINFCQEFFADEVEINAVDIFERLIALSPNPFSALYKLEDKFLICASPERFLTKKGSTVFSQPMKGTIKRNLIDEAEDEKLKTELKLSTKDQSENVMVVDLVRNDLTKICKDATVKVDELFGVYTYPHVHQMISTISGQLKDDIKFSEIIEATFPMGSMTGAPKHRVMQLIDEHEVSARGIFSGSVGYINPNGDFDFNVVIRSIMYNEATKYLSYQVGSGITFYSNPEKEWEECLLKGEAIKKVLGSLEDDS